MRLLTLAFVLLASFAAACAPVERSQRVAPRFGERARLLSWTTEEKQAGFANMDRIYAVRAIPRVVGQPRPAYPLPVALRDLSQVRVEGIGTLEDFRQRHHVAGMLVIQGGKIVYEQYAFGHAPDKKWTSWSVAKSVVSMLVGAAIKDGYIGRLDDLVSDYLPGLKRGAYAAVTLEQLLQMSSGVHWNERYDDPKSDVARFGALRVEGEPAIWRYLNAKPREHAPGTHFNYNTAETHLVGSVVRAAVGNNLSEYLSRAIWSRFAMESDAFWMIDDKSGTENGGCCMSATLRDYGRIGLLALRKGRLSDGTSVLPEGFMDEATKPSAAFPGYGYLWWLGQGTYGARGIFGQHLQVYPEEDLVIVTHMFADKATGPFEDAARMFEAIRSALSKRGG